MKFKNIKGTAQKIRIMENRKLGGTMQACHWITLKPGQIIDLPSAYGKAMGFEMVMPEQGVGVKEETPKESEENPPVAEEDVAKFGEELQAIKGIGKKTVSDILKVFWNKEMLINTIQKGEGLPFRDDISQILHKQYGN